MFVQKYWDVLLTMALFMTNISSGKETGFYLVETKEFYPWPLLLKEEAENIKQAEKRFVQRSGQTNPPQAKDRRDAKVNAMSDRESESDQISEKQREARDAQCPARPQTSGIPPLPHVPILSKHYEIKNNDTLVHDKVHPTGIDSRKEILVAVVLTIGIVIAGLVLVCRSMKLLCFPHRGKRRNKRSIKMICQETFPVQESVGQWDQHDYVEVPFVGATEAQSLSHVANESAIIMEPRYVQEYDAEEETSMYQHGDEIDNPGFIDIQRGYPNGTRKDCLQVLTKAMRGSNLSQI